MKILITGASSGLGYDLAKSLSLRGHSVYVTTHTEKEVLSVKKKIHDEKLNMLCFKLDITSNNDIEMLKSLSIDVLVANAAIGNGGSIFEMDTDILKDTYEVNLFSTVKLVKIFYQSNKYTKNRLKIFIISSLVGNIPIPYIGAYSSSKSALSHLTHVMRKELIYLNNNISISLVEPSAYKTGFNQVMIDNKINNTYKDSKIYKNVESINRLQRNLFTLIESNKYNKINSKIIKQIEKENPKFLIRTSILHSILVKTYLFFSK